MQLVFAETRRITKVQWNRPSSFTASGVPGRGNRTGDNAAPASSTGRQRAVSAVASSTLRTLSAGTIVVRRRGGRHLASVGARLPFLGAASVERLQRLL